jgi:hypothetical protein
VHYSVYWSQLILISQNIHMISTFNVYFDSTAQDNREHWIFTLHFFSHNGRICKCLLLFLMFRVFKLILNYAVDRWWTVWELCSKIAPWSRILLEKPIFAQLVTKFLAFLWNLKFLYRVHNNTKITKCLSISISALRLNPLTFESVFVWPE